MSSQIGQDPYIYSTTKLPVSVALLSCAFFTICFVGGFYLFERARTVGNERKSRDHPFVIKKRMQTISVTCVISFVGVWALLHFYGMFKEQSILYQLKATCHLVGLSLPLDFFQTLCVLTLPLLLTFILFLGPLLAEWFCGDFDLYHNATLLFTSLINFRNYIFAPFAEEFVFRCCMVPILYYAGLSVTNVILFSPMFFGIAHIHHAWEYWTTYGRSAKAAQIAVISSAFQFIYTTIFGWYATFLFLRTGNILAPFLSHSFCNMMGFPSLSLPGVSLGIKLFVYIGFLVGLIGFWVLLLPLTDPTIYGNNVYWRIT